MAQGFKDMQKNPQENFTTVEIDPVSGEHIITIPEWICDEKGWYEGTEVNIEVENDCIIIRISKRLMRLAERGLDGIDRVL